MLELFTPSGGVSHVGRIAFKISAIATSGISSCLPALIPRPTEAGTSAAPAHGAMVIVAALADAEIKNSRRLMLVLF